MTDHCPNTYFKTQPTLSRRQARWSETFQQFQFEWEYRPGRINVADPLSRLPDRTVRTLGTPHYLRVMSVSSRPGPDHQFTEPAGGASPTLVTRFKDAYESATDLKPHIESGVLLYDNGLWYRGDRLVVPGRDLRREVCGQAHDSPYSGHFGQTKTIDLVQRHYWWPGMRKDIIEYVRTCDTCQRCNYSRLKPAGLVQPLHIPTSPWEAVSMDFIMDLPKTKTDNNAIIVFVDRLTKMVRLAATTTEVFAKETADLLIHNVVRHHGLPKELLTDRDSRFTSGFFSRLSERWGIRHLKSTAYHPQTDGQTEVMNRTVEDYLRSYSATVQDDWDQQLSLAEFAINNAKNESTKETPFFLNYGRHVVTPLSYEIPARLAQSDTTHTGCEGYQVPDQIPAVTQLTAKVASALKLAKEHLEQARDRQRRVVDPHRRDVVYQVGDRVLLQSKNISLKHPGTKKLLPRWLGPFRVEARIGEVAYRLALPASMKRIHPVFHVSKLALYKEGGRVQPPPPPIELEGELEYTVENILDKRVRRVRNKQRTEYLVKWAGYGHEHNSWEPKRNMTNCAEILQTFENQYTKHNHPSGARRSKRLKRR